MLSKSCEDLCRPEDEITCHEDTRDVRTYSGSALNPFEELLSAIILSRPISHRLGLRTISTILNAPYNFNSAKAVKDAGHEKHLQAVWDARTQHKDKTAEQMGLFADVVLEKFTSSDDKEGTQLNEVREVCNKNVEKEREFLQSNVKGLGKTGLDIFFRRVQWLWTAGFPFVDDRTAQGLRKSGLPDDGQELWKAVQEHWGELETKHLAGEDEDVRKRMAFVVVLERATGADLEGKADALVQKAAAV
ncbi:hypothetical protein EJ03DRAFT_341729 [Teratosphaeria nubilosa]|uniref:Uncharacterized protein n=1 Tax=Teratosphaeria nubilosa TaxID=161662 RepID=A0A6G1LIC7_9PEZI|nr:hypothetical protein EJ03DRAFT_341729 [Teratosphaeria nubilosa]